MCHIACCIFFFPTRLSISSPGIPGLPRSLHIYTSTFCPILFYYYYFLSSCRIMAMALTSIWNQKCVEQGIMREREILKKISDNKCPMTLISWWFHVRQQRLGLLRGISTEEVQAMRAPTPTLKPKQRQYGEARRRCVTKGHLQKLTWLRFIETSLVSGLAVLILDLENTT